MPSRVNCFYSFFCFSGLLNISLRIYAQSIFTGNSLTLLSDPISPSAGFGVIGPLKNVSNTYVYTAVCTSFVTLKQKKLNVR